MSVKRSGRKTRGNGEGSIYQRKDGRWCAEVPNGYRPDGKARYKYLYGKSRKEVSEKLTKALYEAQKGILAESNNISVSEWLRRWLENYMKDSLRPSTYESYGMFIRLHIAPHLGKVKLKDLNTERIQALYNYKFRDVGLAPRSVERIHTVLHKALEQAVAERKIPYNPAKATTLPPREQKEVRALTLEEQQVFEEALKEERLEAAFLVGIYAGLRRGEILGLKWEDIDLENHAIRTRKALLRIKDKYTGISQLSLEHLKTKKSLRTVPIPEELVICLKRHKVKQAAEKLKAGPMYQDQQLVFCTTLGTFIEPRNFNRAFSRIISNAGIEDFTLHGLRHTYTTRLSELGIDPKIRQELLGHEKPSTTEGYNHVFWQMMRMAIDKLNNYIKERKVPSTEEGTR